VGLSTAIGTATAGLGGRYAKLKFNQIENPQYRMDIKFNRIQGYKITATSVSIGNELQAGINITAAAYSPRTAKAGLRRTGGRYIVW